MIDGGTPKVIFKEDGHVYWDRGGKKTISVSTVISNFHDHMDEPYWHTHGAFKKLLGEDEVKALKREYLESIGMWRMPYIMKAPNGLFDKLSYYVNPEDFFNAKDEVKQEWLNSQIFGTKFHEEREQECYDRGWCLNPHTGDEIVVEKFEKQYDNQTLSDDLFTLEDGCYPELLVWGDFENICVPGQVDLAFLRSEEGVRYVSVDDYKTNKKLGKKDSYYKFHAPFEHLSDSKLVKYQLQQSMYCYLLELQGFEIEYLSITHYTNYDPETGKHYPFEYLREEVAEMIRLVDELNK